MVRRILISASASHLRIAITEDGKLVELFTETPDTEHHVGNIYLGRVTKIIQGMNAAFVDIGLEQDAFLHFSDVDSTMEDMSTDDDEDDRPVSHAVETAAVALRTSKAGSNKRLPTFNTKRSGQVTINLQAKQMVVVQVTREAYHQKGVRVTTKVGLTGRNVVLLPFEENVGVSRKIFSVKERKRLRAIAREILPEGIGCIIRTAAAGLTNDDVGRDFASLLEDWREMEKEIRDAKGPMLLLQEASVAHSVIRDLFKDDVAQVVVDDRKLFRDLKTYVQRTAPHLDGKLEFFADTKPMFDVYGIEREVHLTHSRRVPLPSGGSLIIDHTEAMVVVDVNSGRASNERTQEANAVKSNFEAMKEVAKQLRLRDIGGMVLVDFIDMQQEENRRKLFAEMKKETSRDRAKTIVYPITQLGIMQITRQRIRQSMAERTSEECPFCMGTGRVLSAASTVAGIDRWLRNYRAKTWGLRVTVATHPYIIHYIERNKASTLRRWLRTYFLSVSLREDDTIEAGEFRCYAGSNTKDITRQFL
ncbi:MAG TPA: Rne/Rng family ribonuclease [Candidatus Didemnitutus sp.]|nr:Rne/Rng family ribonuclease [Candidatus Didemnitutus sp.]